MSPPADGSATESGRAYQWCLHELSQPFPDYAKAQVYATLSLNETLQDVTDKLSNLTRELAIMSRRR